MFALILDSVLSLDGSWEFAFREGRSCHESIEPEFAATDRIPVPGCFDSLFLTVRTRSRSSLRTAGRR